MKTPSSLSSNPSAAFSSTFTLRTRLALIMALSALALAGFGWWSLSRLSDTANRLATLAQQGQSAAQQTSHLKGLLAERHAQIGKLRLAYTEGTADMQLMLETKLQGLNELLGKEIAALSTREGMALGNEAKDQFNYQATLYVSYMKQLQDSLRTGNMAFADRTLSHMLTPAYMSMDQHLNAVAEQQQARQEAAILAIGNESQTYRTTGIILLVLGGLLLLCFPVVLFWGVVRRMSVIQPILERLQKGELSEEALPEGNDEVGKIARGINTVSHNLAQAASFAHAVGQNQFDAPFEAAGENDLLGSALVDMRDRLRDVAEDEARRSWAIRGMAQFGEILRAHQDLDTFADQIISNLTRYIDAVQGAFFILQDEGQGKPSLKLAGCYAYDRKKYVDRTFALGEGLAGQSALERATICITEVPQNYVSITSGLGQANPQALLVVPLISNDTLFGVLEFAAFRHFPPHVVEFVEKLAENIASTLTHVKNNERTMLLLEETQRMTEALKTNEEELRQNMEELHATHEEMKRVQLEMAGQVNALNNAALVSEADIKGDIIYCNDTFCLVAKYTREELMGKNHRLLKSGHQPQELFEDLWATVSKGKVWQGEVKNRAKDGTYYWVAATITPVLGSDGKPTKYIGVRFDITLQKQQDAQISHQLEEAQAQEEELRQNSEEMAAQQEEMARIQLELKGQVDALNNAALVSEADIKGDIIYCNDTFCLVARYTREELLGHNHRLLKSGHQPQELFEDLWATVSRGKVWRGEVKNRAKDGSYYWVAATITPVLGTDGRPVKYIGVRFDITDQKAQEEHIRQVLEESQAQEEELRQNAEEMAAQQEEMARVQLELKGQVDALNAAALVSEVDLKGDIIYCNDTFCLVAKYTREELMGNNHRMLKSGHQPQELFEDLWATVSGGKVWRGEVKNRAKDGSYYWVAATISPVMGADGRPAKYIGVRFDITGQKAQEDQVRKVLEETQAQEEELRQNAEEMAAQQEEMARLQAELQGQLKAINRSTAVVEFDIRGNIIQANDIFLNLMSYSLQEVQGRHHRMFVDSGMAVSDTYKRFWEDLQNGQFISGEFRRIAKDGSSRWIQGSYNPVFNNDGVLYKIVKFATDVTESKLRDLAVEEELARVRQSESQLRQQLAILQHQALIEITENGEIGAISPGLLAVAGYESAELNGKQIEMLTGNVDTTGKDLYHKLASQQSQQQNFTIITKSGEKMLLHGYFSRMHNNGHEKVIGMLNLQTQ
ncbi:MAG: PAS domain-containing protein [Bacteroidetes bacterium]|nr:PAS domain-containing protein [Bacteroidota bacterium]